MNLSELAASVEWPFGLIIGEDQVLGQAITAARQYLAWGNLSGIVAGDDGSAPDELASVTGGLAVTSGEWGVIKPLFMLYVERENTRALEASRGQGVDVYGRDSNAIEGDIQRYESEELPRKAFSAMPESI